MILKEGKNLIFLDYNMIILMANRIGELVVNTISLLKKGKVPAVEFAEKKFSIVKMRDGGGILSDEQKEKLENIEKSYIRHWKK